MLSSIFPWSWLWLVAHFVRVKEVAPLGFSVVAVHTVFAGSLSSLELLLRIALVLVVHLMLVRLLFLLLIILILSIGMEELAHSWSFKTPAWLVKEGTHLLLVRLTSSKSRLRLISHFVRM